jgi:hypothetical protein
MVWILTAWGSESMDVVADWTGCIMALFGACRFSMCTIFECRLGLVVQRWNLGVRVAMANRVGNQRVFYILLFKVYPTVFWREAECEVDINCPFASGSARDLGTSRAF